MHSLSKHFFVIFLATTIMASCSRPVAYFQASIHEPVAAASTPATPVSVAATPAADIATPVDGPVVQAVAAVDQMEAMVRKDSKLSANKTVQKRLSRVRNLLTTTSAKSMLTATSVSAPKKMNLMERLMLKKMNKKISRQLAPANPEKAMVSTGTLATGAVLVIVGLLLLLLTTGTAATIGLIALLVGAVVLLVGLL